ncbi:MAG: phosphoribosylamine--glycine ligase [Bacteriovoracaceae bacterium]
MNILIIGSGGREHCLAWKCAQSPLANQIYVIPGNPGMLTEKKIVTNNQIDPGDFLAVKEFCEKNAIKLVIIGPEKYLSLGIVDFLMESNILTFGPNKAASFVEASKIFSKHMMKNAGINTAPFVTFENASILLDSVKNLDDKLFYSGYVVKADILAQGKGVVVCDTKDEVITAVNDLVKNKIVDKNRDKILVERKIRGREVSAFAICDGENYLPLGFACDYKRIRDNNEGPNTGGMGTYSPAHWLEINHELKNKINETVFGPFLKALTAEGINYRGVLFAGIMVDEDNNFEVLEYNCRFGDPETQSLLPLIDEDIVPLFIDAASGKIDKNKKTVKLKKLSAMHVVLSAYGYPGTEGIAIKQGDKITYPVELCKSNKEFSVKIFFAGVGTDSERNLVTNGGRVLGVTAIGESLPLIRKQIYQEITKIDFYKKHFRSDIGL